MMKHETNLAELTHRRGPGVVRPDAILAHHARSEPHVSGRAAKSGRKVDFLRMHQLLAVYREDRRFVITREAVEETRADIAADD